MQILERKIEARVVSLARARGWLVKKLNGLPDRGWPDRLFVGPGFVAFIEFKRPGAATTPLQGAAIETLKAFGHPAAVFSDAGAAWKWLLELESKAIPDARCEVAPGARRRRAVS